MTGNGNTKVITEKIAPAIQQAQMTQDTATINKLMKEYKGFQDEMNAYSKKFIEQNKDAYLFVLLLENFLMRQQNPIQSQPPRTRLLPQLPTKMSTKLLAELLFKLLTHHHTKPSHSSYISQGSP